MQALNIFNIYQKSDFLLNFENFLVLLAKLKFNLISNRLEVVQSNLIFVKRLKPVLSKVNFRLFHYLLQIGLIEALTKVRETAIRLLTEVLQILCYQRDNLI